MRKPPPDRRPRRGAPLAPRVRTDQSDRQERPPAPVSRRQERAGRPWPASQSLLPDITLIVGAGALLFYLHLALGGKQATGPLGWYWSL